MKSLKPKLYFSKSHLSVFLIVFAVLGIVLLLESLAAPNPSLPGDLNNDNTVNITDLSILLSDYGTANSNADLNSDGSVNILDMSILLSHYGQSINTKPTVPAGLSATAAAGSVDLKWSAKPSSDNVDTYQVYWTTDSTWNGTIQQNLSISGTTYTVTGLTGGTTYYFRISAHNSVGYGDWSDPVSVVAGGGSSNLGTKLPARMPQSTGTTYYVDGTNGNDANSGSSSAPWKTINHALATVPLSGSIIKVLPGTYNSSGTGYAINFNRQGNTANPITLEAATPGTVTINNANLSVSTYGAWIHAATGLRIEGLTFQLLTTPHANIGTGAGAVLIEQSSKVELSGCTFYEVGAQGIIVRGGLSGQNAPANDVWIFGNIFRSSGSNPFAQVTGVSYSSDQYFGSLGSHWIYAGQVGDSSSFNYTSGSRRLVIANNVFSGTTAGYDVELGPQAIEDYVVNNTFYGNHSLSVLGTAGQSRYSGNGVVPFADISDTTYNTGTMVVTNNIFSDLDGHSVQMGGSSPELNNLVQANLSYATRNGEGINGNQSADYDAFFGTTGPMFSTGTGNYPDADPLFIGAGSFNYQLQAASPAIGKADPAYAYPYDLTGKARPASPDLGAYQH